MPMVKKNSEPGTVEITHPSHVALARRIAVEAARGLGFDPIAVDEIAITVTELATNLVKHGAESGKISISAIEDEDMEGMEIASMDFGPGIANIDLAIKDGFSTHGTTGGGLGAANRLMDEFHITSKTAYMPNVKPSEVGTRIMCRKWLPRKISSRIHNQKGMNFSVLARPFPGEKCSGDVYFLKHYNDIHLIVLIDGLGHGEKANFAAETARRFVEDNYRKDFDYIFQGVHRACKKTRGVAMSACRIDLENKTLTYAGIGNVATRVFNSPEPINPANFSGTLGVVLRRTHVFNYPWKGGIIVMYTDGLKSRWSLCDFPGLENKPPIEIASMLLKKLGRNTDDAAIIVGK